MTTRLGRVTSAGDGIYIEQLANAADDGNIAMRVSNVEAGTGFGIRSLGWTGTTSVISTGTVRSTSTTGMHITSTSDAISIDSGGTGVVIGGDEEITADATFGVAGGDVTVLNAAPISRPTPADLSTRSALRFRTAIPKC